MILKGQIEKVSECKEIVGASLCFFLAAIHKPYWNGTYQSSYFHIYEYISHRSEYIPHIFVNILLYLFM